MENEVLYQYRDETLYVHHTLSRRPDPQDFSFRSHSHNMLEIYCYISGNVEYVVEGRIHRLQPWDVVLTDRGQVRNIRILSEQTDYERMAILADPFILPKGTDIPLAAARSGFYHYSPGTEERQFLKHCFSLLEKSELSGLAPRDAILSMTSAILTQLTTLRLPEHHGEHAGDALVDQILNYINAHLTEEWTLKTLEKALYRDKTYLNRQFKGVMGCSIWEYTLRKRVFSAQQQLYLYQSVSKAYETSGFKDYSTFFRRYKKYIGRSPSEDLRSLLP